MANLIDKDALVAEIEKRIADVTDECKKSKRPQFTLYGKINALENLLPFINTLEVKEVDLEKEYEEFVVDDPILGNFITNDTMGRELAKHFFELGMSVSNKAQKGEEA